MTARVVLAAAFTQAFLVQPHAPPTRVLRALSTARPGGGGDPSSWAPHKPRPKKGKKGKAELMRLERVVANRGAGSRSECTVLIKRGRVRVDGVLVKSPSQRVKSDAAVTVDGAELSPVPLLVAFHKDVDVLSTIGDPWGRVSLKETTPEHWPRMNLHPVGRLDRDTSGLLLFSSDGKLTNLLLHPHHEVEREYIAEVEGDAMAPGLATRLAAGVATADGTYPARLLEQQPGSVRVVVTEGKYRMVRRILANVGLPVETLHRVRYGPVTLADLNLAPGEWTDDLGDEVEAWVDRLRRRAPAPRLPMADGPDHDAGPPKAR